MREPAKRRTLFEERGLIKVEGLIRADDAFKARNAVFALAKEHDLFAGGIWLRSQSRFGVPKAFRNALNSLNRSNDFPDLINQTVLSLSEELVGEPVTPMPPGQQILFTLPGDGHWVVPHDVWHLDLPRFGEQRSPGLQIFTFLEDVEPGGGGTLVVAGSHRLLNNSGRLTSKKIKQLLSRENYFRTLFDPVRRETAALEDLTGTVGKIDLEVTELCGKVGDIFLMDLRMLHTPAPNGSDKARIMLTCRLPRLSILEQFNQPESSV